MCPIQVSDHTFMESSIWGGGGGGRGSGSGKKW